MDNYMFYCTGFILFNVFIMSPVEVNYYFHIQFTEMWNSEPNKGTFKKQCIKNGKVFPLRVSQQK